MDSCKPYTTIAGPPRLCAILTSMTPLLLMLACAELTPETAAPAFPDLPDPELESAEGWSDDGDQLFNRLAVHQVEITLDADDLTALAGEPYTYVQGDVTFDGLALDPVGVRLKGHIGSFRELSGKAGFKIDLNRYFPDQKLYGQKQLTLNNAVTDCSYSKEHLGYTLYRAAGVPVPRNGFAWVRVNGQDYGLYVLTETPDDQLLERHFEEPDGNLYDGKYLYYDNGGYQLMDFWPALAPYFEQEEGEDVANADIVAFTSEVETSVYQPDFYGRMSSVLNWERQHTHVAIDQLIGHLDGYSMNTNNYRVYFDPADQGRAVLLPFDLDYAFLSANVWGMNWSYPRARLTSACWADAECIEAQRESMDWVLQNAYDENELQQVIDEVEALITPYVEADPRRECNMAQVGNYRADLRRWVRARPEQMEDFWEL